MGMVFYRLSSPPSFMCLGPWIPSKAYECLSPMVSLEDRVYHCWIDCQPQTMKKIIRRRRVWRTYMLQSSSICAQSLNSVHRTRHEKSMEPYCTFQQGARESSGNVNSNLPFQVIRKMCLSRYKDKTFSPMFVNWICKQYVDRCRVDVKSNHSWFDSHPSLSFHPRLG